MRNRSMSLVDAKLLHLFDVVYSTRSVTQAAEQLGQSQPTISISLAKLREHFHDPLFVRTPKGMQPTPRADLLIVPAREALQSLKRVSQWETGFDPATVEREFRICMTDASHVTLLPQLLAKVRSVAPRVQLEAARIDETLPHALQSGEADLALGFIPRLTAGFYEQALYTQDWVCLTRNKHPRISKKELTLQTYKSEAHIAIVSGTGQQLLETALKKHNIHRRVLLKLPGFLGLAGILSVTDLIATLPRNTAETLARLKDLSVHSCPFRIPTFTVKQYWHSRYHRDPANVWLRGICAELFQKK